MSKKCSIGVDGYTLEVKGVIPGPISMIKSSFIREDLPYEMLLQQMTQALEEELKSFEQLGIRMIQIEEPWLFRKTSVKYREHQKNVKLEMAYLNGFVSRIREMIIVQVNTYVWKRNYNELLKSNAIDLVSLNLPNEQHLMDLCASFKSIKVNFIVNLSCFKFEGAIDLERLNHLKKYFNNRMLWFNVDLPPEDWPEQSQILKLIKKELPQLVLL